MLLHRPKCLIKVDWEDLFEEILRDSSNVERKNMDTLFWHFIPEDDYGYNEEFYLLNPDFPEWRKAHKVYSLHEVSEGDSHILIERVHSKRSRRD